MIQQLLSAGVQAHINQNASDSEFQGCCLHSLNLVICHSSKIKAVKKWLITVNKHSYTFTIPRRDRHIILCLCLSARRAKINGLCKTRWVERHDTFSTILELYSFLVKTWEQICLPTEEDNEIYPNGNDWNWDSESWGTANSLNHIFTSFENVVAFLLSKVLLEPIRLIAECLQGRLPEVYLVSKNVMR